MRMPTSPNLPIDRPCPRCGAQPKENCKPTGRTIRGMHAERWGKVKTPGTAKPAAPPVELPNAPEEPEDLAVDAMNAMHEHLEPEGDEAQERENPPEE